MDIKDCVDHRYLYRDCPYLTGWQFFCRGYCMDCTMPLFVTTVTEKNQKPKGD